MFNIEIHNGGDVKNLLLENYSATVCEIAMQGFLNSVDSSLIKPTIIPGPRLEPQGGIQV